MNLIFLLKTDLVNILELSSHSSVYLVTFSVNIFIKMTGNFTAMHVFVAKSL